MEQAVSHSTASAVRVGRWWFQRRGVSPLPLIVLCLILPAQFRLSGAQLWLVAAGVLLAEWVRIWAVGHAGSVTRTRGDTVPRLIHAGPFRYVRNPLYLANIAMYALCGVAFGFGWFSLFIAAYFAVQYHFIVAFEEDTLRREFGVAYAFYCARVARWLPAFSPTVETSSHPFELKKALRSERATLLALVVIAALVIWKRSL